MLCHGIWRLQIRGWRLKWLLFGLIINIILIALLRREHKITSVLDLELHKCPACFGTSMCTQMMNGQIILTGWNRWKFMNFLNQKNVFFARLNDQNIVLKKLAHDWEIASLDRWLCNKAFSLPYPCDVGKAAIILGSPNVTYAHLLKILNTEGNGFLHCPSERLIQKIRDVFKLNEPLSNRYANILTLMYTNPEPLIIQAFPYEDGWPFPKYLGACGRVIVENYVGPSLTSFASANWKIRVRLAYKLTQLAEKLSNNPASFCLYMTDITFSNFAVSPKDEIILVDVENVIVTDRHLSQIDASNGRTLKPKKTSLYANHVPESQKHLIFSAEELCSHDMADHNYYVICQGILSSNPWSNEVPGGLLHSLPAEIDHRLNITRLVDECSRPQSHFGRFAIFPQLQAALLQAFLESF